MFDHVTIRVADRAAGERFYDTVLPTLGFERTNTGPAATEWDDFHLEQADDGAAVTHGLHIGFRAVTHNQVRDFWQVGVDAGYRDDGVPGPRTIYGPDYFGGFLLDPDGNSAEAVNHGNMRNDGTIDHLWIRVRDAAASKDFYAGIGARAGFRLVADEPELGRFSNGNGSFSVLNGNPARNVHLAFRGDEAASLTDPDGNTVAIVA